MGTHLDGCAGGADESVRGPAVAVYRPRLLLPLLALTASIAVARYVTGPDSAEHPWFFVTFWIICAVPLVIRYRHAVILTASSLIVRAVFGAPLEIPLSGVKRAYWLPWEAGEPRTPTVRIEMIVSGYLDVAMSVRNADEVVRRVNEAVSLSA